MCHLLGKIQAYTIRQSVALECKLHKSRCILCDAHSVHTQLACTRFSVNTKYMALQASIFFIIERFNLNICKLKTSKQVLYLMDLNIDIPFFW